ncbi:esterase FE4-like [Schistocerca gregaria]|uniref:esterase FE4-like n=1 Tax=Schistocerca gregaria TaxID=7010 RepID=UPI00211EF3A4|nr:esterase FE4-like [Schistocerca gregaria]
MMLHLKLIWLAHVLLLCIHLKHVQGAGTYKTIDTPLGSLRGQQLTTTAGNTVYFFRGIPYAEPPVGGLRFQPPVPISPWTERRDALAASSSCTQLTGKGTIEGTEDCLYLNVFTPELPSDNDNPKPVLVNIHGGCFTAGSGGSRPSEYFIDNGIVYVAINYRLGPLGFMSTGDSLLPGNLGMKDQVLALQWVQQNIAAFGGNPNDVTIFGQSAGGASVHYHLLSPLSKGLFHRGIASSGAALNPWAFDKNAADRTFRYVSYLGYNAESTSDLMDFLMNVEATELVKAKSPALSDEDRTGFMMCVWVPHVEPENDGAFLTEEPWVIMSEGRYNQVPYLTGITSYELLSRTQANGAFASEDGVKNLNDNFDAYVAHDLRISDKDEQLEVSAQIRQFYFGDNEITLKDNDTIATLASDLMFVEGIDTVVRNMSLSSAEPVYYYEFSFNGPLSTYPDFPGACHGDDARYMSNYAGQDPNSAAYKIGLQMNQVIANFIKYGDPTPNTDDVVTVDWNTYSSDSTNYLEFASPLYVSTGLNKERMDFWHSVMP